MKYLITALCLMFSTLAFAELPPPGTARKGKITVDPYNTGTVYEYDLSKQAVLDRAARKKAQAKVQRTIDDLRRKVAELERENRILRGMDKNINASNGAIAATPRAAEPQRAVTESPRKKNIISVLGGIGPSHLSDRRESGGNEVALRTGPVAGIQYQRFVTESVVLGAQVQVPTYKDRSGGDGLKKDVDRYTGLISAGWAF